MDPPTTRLPPPIMDPPLPTRLPPPSVSGLPDRFPSFLGAPIPKYASPQHFSECIGGFRPAAHMGWGRYVTLCVRWWFPSFLKALKDVVAFLRSHIEDTCTAYDQAGPTGAAIVLRRLPIANFAEWRWDTLGNVCKSVTPSINNFAQALLL